MRYPFSFAVSIGSQNSFIFIVIRYTILHDKRRQSLFSTNKYDISLILIFLPTRNDNRQVKAFRTVFF